MFRTLAVAAAAAVALAALAFQAPSLAQPGGSGCRSPVTAARAAAVIQACLAQVWSSNSAVRTRASQVLAEAANSVRPETPDGGRAAPRPGATHVVRNACPFEGCTFGMWTVRNRRVAMRPGPSNAGRATAMLPVGERVAALGSILTVRPVAGRVVGRYPGTRPGETVYLLDNLGEGFANVWVNGRIVQYGGSDCAASVPCDQVFRFPRTEAPARWWIRIQRQDGQRGWVEGNEHFDGTDSLG